MFLDDGYQDVNGDGDPDLSFDGILGGSIKRFDAEMLLDPFEEDLDLPATLKQLGDGQCR